MKCLLSFAFALLLASCVPAYGEQSEPTVIEVTEPSKVIIRIEPLGSTEPEGEGEGEGETEPPSKPDDIVVWNGTSPNDKTKNPQHSSLVEGKVGLGLLGDWIDENNPAAQTNPVIAFSRGGGHEDPQTAGMALRFWYRAEDLDHIIVQSRSWDFKGKYLTRIENPPTTWTLFEMPFSDMTKIGDIESVDHIVFDRDQNGPGLVWVDEVYFAAPSEQDPEPGPDPAPGDRTARVSDQWSVAFREEQSYPDALATAPLSLGENEDGAWKIGYAHLTEGAVDGPSMAIKTAPFYLPDAEKLAFIGFELGGMVLGGGDTIMGTIVGPESRPVEFIAQTDTSNPWSGERVYVADFSAVRAEGEYRFQVDGLGSSRPFTVSAQAYDIAAGHVARAFAYQTEGMQLSFPRVKNTIAGLIQGDVLTPTWNYDKRVKNGYAVYDAAAHTIAHHSGAFLLEADQARLMADAADMDCHVKHVDTVLSLLNTYLLEPEKYHKGQFGVPNDTDYPDIVWLALLELQVWANLQDVVVVDGVKGAGGVPSVIQFNRQRELSDLVAVCGRPDKQGSFAWGMAFDLMGQATGDPSWVKRALRAFGWGILNGLEPKIVGHIGGRGRGEPYEWELTQDACDEINAAASIWEAGIRARLWKSTGDGKFIDRMPVPKDFRALDPFKDATLWVYWELRNVPGFEWVAETFQSRAERFIQWRTSSSNQYRQSWKPDINVLSFGKGLGYLPARELALWHHHTKDTRFRDAAVGNIGFTLGANAWGKSMTSYVGDWFTNYQDMKPYVPGTTIYGWSTVTRMPFETPFRDKAGAPHPKLTTPFSEFTTHETFGAAAVALLSLASLDTPDLGAKLNAVQPVDKEGWYLP